MRRGWYGHTQESQNAVTLLNAENQCHYVKACLLRPRPSRRLRGSTPRAFPRLPPGRAFYLPPAWTAGASRNLLSAFHSGTKINSRRSARAGSHSNGPLLSQLTEMKTINSLPTITHRCSFHQDHFPLEASASKFRVSPAQHCLPRSVRICFFGENETLDEVDLGIVRHPAYFMCTSNKGNCLVKCNEVAVGCCAVTLSASCECVHLSQLQPVSDEAAA